MYFDELKNDKRFQTFYELNESLNFKKLPFDSLSHHLSVKFYFIEDLNLIKSTEGVVVISNLELKKIYIMKNLKLKIYLIIMKINFLLKYL